MILCPKCGAKSSERQFVGPFCVKCYNFKFEIPKKVRIVECTRCKKIWVNEGWVPYNKKAIEKYVASKFKGDFEKLDYYLDSGTAVAYYNVDGEIHMINREFQTKFEKTICPSCSRRSGGYYEAIIQLRGDRHRINSNSKKLITLLGSKTFVTKVEEKREGIDLFVGSSKAVFELLKEISYSYKISRKLFTQKEGRRLYRTTFAIRFEK
ncbi:MAG: NMD3-related protein [Candidatus ainarchaeum sp.]|nr:NMD3-related protein [Candidatus ainarchaeum sp.]